MSDILIQNGRVIDPQSGLDEVTDLLIRDGQIAGVGTGSGDAADAADAAASNFKVA